jgi:predicted RNase H-like HicB family nuclease
MKLKIVLEKGTDGYIVAYCPALKGCVTQGRTRQEATDNLKEAIELFLDPDPEDIKRCSSGEYEVRELVI